jgi:pilus assembly protein CpaB
MNVARILILAAAAVAAVIAAIVVRGAMQAPAPAAPAPVVEQERPAPAVHVLAARADLPVGHRVEASDLYWQPWPEDAVSNAYITERARAEAIDEFTGGVVRAGLSQGEPVSERKIIQAGNSSFMAAVVSPGMRAVAVPVSARSSAGGFILPNDRVDVIITEQNASGHSARTLLENIRVLAIDQNFAEDGSGAVVGSTATLELTPGQSRAISQATAGGTLALALRSAADANGDIVIDEIDDSQRSVRVFRSGAEQRVALGSGG